MSTPIIDACLNAVKNLFNYEKQQPIDYEKLYLFSRACKEQGIEIIDLE